MCRSSSDERLRGPPTHGSTEQNTDRDSDVANRARQSHHRRHHHHHQQQQQRHHHVNQQQQQQVRDKRRDADRRPPPRHDVPARSSDSWQRENTAVDNLIGNYTHAVTSHRIGPQQIRSDIVFANSK